MLKKIGLGLLTLVVVLALISFFLPSTVSVERTTVVKASAETVFNQVNSPRQWDTWSPWKEQDPNITNEYSGPESGPGASNTWKSPKLGDGSQTIVASSPYNTITLELDFGRGSKPQSNWKFEETPEGTKVSWDFKMDLGMNPIARYMGLMMGGMVGPSYEKGLENLKKVCESMPATTPTVETEPITPTTEQTPVTSTTEEVKK
jgi:hypothetical protein